MLIENSARVTVIKIIELGHELGMKVVAEGVETKEQLQFLQVHHCDIAQGYYFSKPIALDDLHQWIENNYGF
ncbi:Oxygen sensor protein DosP [Legionella massiliensis]|uniref:Oxygen sensor protein DosP n=1 Tax=Legionella massiliensis TaxID=1034943 RepID=A0A078L5G2_9GAMM|nr:Oxygen sensor protein DosP [Legionella massiliensis]CEE15067.1 Oxygen sensor protein DosP [Legionella massiliensis]